MNTPPSTPQENAAREHVLIRALEILYRPEAQLVGPGFWGTTFGLAAAATRIILNQNMADATQLGVIAGTLTSSTMILLWNLKVHRVISAIIKGGGKVPDFAQERERPKPEFKLPEFNFVPAPQPKPVYATDIRPAKLASPIEYKSEGGFKVTTAIRSKDLACYEFPKSINPPHVHSFKTVVVDRQLSPTEENLAGSKGPFTQESLGDLRECLIHWDWGVQNAPGPWSEVFRRGWRLTSVGKTGLRVVDSLLRSYPPPPTLDNMATHVAL